MSGSIRTIQHATLTTLKLTPILAVGLVLGPVNAAVAQDAYPHATETIGNVEQIYDGALTPDLAVNTFRNIDRLFPTRTIKAGGKPSELPKSERELGKVAADIKGEKYDLYDYLALNQVSGLIVLKDGKVVYETYQRGNTPTTRWMSMSVAKSISSTLVGAAIKDGLIKSLDDNVVIYVPRLEGTAYDGATVRDVLMMSSGVKWNEKYTDPASDRRALLRAQIAQKPGGAMEVMAALPRAAEPGSVNTYSTGETQVLAEILRGAIKKPLADYLSEKIWVPYGMEADAKWWLDSPEGVEIGGSGLSATLRDFARFGQFFLEGGKVNGTQVLPEGWVTEASTPKTLKGGKPLEYGYMWWTGWTEPSKKDNAFTAVGIQGQYVYINPAHHVVIAQTAAEPKPTGKDVVDPMAFFDAIVATLN
jgi:CubicO group peptidase (beta-lactamase class C family)